MEPYVKLFIDCEFNSGRGQLISMALVADDGAEFYEVVSLPEKIDPWVAANVVPILGKEPISQEEFYKRLFAFLDRYDAPVVIADHPADIQYFAEALITDSKGSAYKHNWYSFRWNVDYVSSQPHNALADARALRDHWKLKGL